MIDLEIKYIDFIKETISRYLQNCKIYIFGSRTKGTARKYSDIDIALDCKDLNENILLKIKTILHLPLLLYLVQIV